MIYKINNRKFLHTSLVIIIIILQCLVLYFWYIETQNDKNLNELNNNVSLVNDGTYYTNESYSKLHESQAFLQDYLKNRNKKSLSKYYESLSGLNTFLDSLDLVLDKSPQNKSSVKFLKQNLDSILKRKSFYLHKKDGSNFKKFDYESILNSVSVDSVVTKDSIARKGFFKRFIDAVSGKTNIQKEELKIIISYKYKNKIQTGDVKSEIERLLNESDKFYSNEAKKLEDANYISDKSNLKLYKLNAQLFESSTQLIESYNMSINSLKNKNKDNFNVITKNHVKKRNYIILILTVLMLLFSLILYRFTQFAFKLEKKLIASQEQILKSLNYKNKIIGMISHEIRSPLSIISIYSKMVSSKVNDTEVKEVFKSIEYTTSTLLLLSGQMLEYSKNENKKIELKKTKFNLSDEIDKIVTPLIPLALTKGNQLVIDKIVSNDYKVFSDATKISQLFYNLVGNAIKFTENGTIKMLITANKSSERILTLAVEVIDTGSGMSKEDLKNIFEDYYQGSNAVNNMGVGLGLKLCKEIVELFKGSIEIDSELYKGTRLTFKIEIDLIDN